MLTAHDLHGQVHPDQRHVGAEVADRVHASHHAEGPGPPVLGAEDRCLAEPFMSGRASPLLQHARPGGRCRVRHRADKY